MHNQEATFEYRLKAYIRLNEELTPAFALAVNCNDSTLASAILTLQDTLGGVIQHMEEAKEAVVGLDRDYDWPHC